MIIQKYNKNVLKKKYAYNMVKIAGQMI